MASDCAGSLLFITDVDGTLLKTGMPIHPKALEAAGDFIRAGGLFGISSGRSMEGAAGLLQKLPVNMPCILCGGAVVYDPGQREILRQIRLEDGIADMLREIMDCFPTVSVTVTDAEKTVNLRINDRLVRRGVYEDSHARRAAADEVRGAVKVLFTDDDTDVLARIGKRWFSGEEYIYLSASTYFRELTARGADKGAALRYIRGMYPGADIYSAGNAQTDIQMCKESRAFFAPENAPETVKSMAERTFPPPEEGGIGEIFRYLTEKMSES